MTRAITRMSVVGVAEITPEVMTSAGLRRAVWLAFAIAIQVGNMVEQIAIEHHPDERAMEGGDVG